MLLNRLDIPAGQAWYADKAAENGWSRKVLDHHITTNLRERIGSAPSNFSQQLPAPDSDLAREIVKDSYVFDFLTLTERATEQKIEQKIEQALMDRLQDPARAGSGVRVRRSAGPLRRRR